MKKLIITTLTSLLLLSCSAMDTPKTSSIQVENVVRIEHKVPKELTLPCLPSKIMSVDSYLDLKFYERENHLTDYINHLIYTIAICNTRLKAIRINQGYEDDSQ